MNANVGCLIERLGLFEHFEKLNDLEKDTFVKSVCRLSDSEWAALINLHVTNERCSSVMLRNSIEKPEYFSLNDRINNADDWTAFKQIGAMEIKAGRVCVLTVAGGQGTRLGFNGPKGLLGVTPIKKKTLFHLFAEKILAAEKKYNAQLHWLIMASEENFEDIFNYFNSTNIFPLNRLHIFKQGALPSFDFSGNCLLQSACSIGFHPDGHGGVFGAMYKNGLLSKLKRLGISTISYFQVDNPLVTVIDEGFVGMHVSKKSEMSSKVVSKKTFGEKVGVFVKQDNALKILEYSDMTDEEANAADEFGSPLYNLGNAAIHLIDLDFIIDVVEKNELPIHVARKAISYWDCASNRIISPTSPNAIKLEKFIFDALPFAKNPILLEIDRAEEFSPVKNFTGQDSLQTSIADQVKRWRRWFSAIDIKFPIDSIDDNSVLLEVSPIFADNVVDFACAWNALKDKPSCLNGLYLE